MYGATRCRLTTGSLTHASLLCMPSPPPSYFGLVLLCSVPRNVLPLPFRSGCTVAFGLCIIITITVNSSWLVAERPHSTIAFSPPVPPLFSFAFILCPPRPLVKCHGARDEEEEEEEGEEEEEEEKKGEEKKKGDRSEGGRGGRGGKRGRGLVARSRVCELIKFLGAYTYEIIVSISADYFLLAINCTLRQGVGQSESFRRVIRCAIE